MNIEDFVYASYAMAKPFVREERDEYVRKPEYARMILQHLGLLNDRIPTILVTGSKGKGSVSRMIAYILEKAGFKVGHFSSPHLLEFRERIRVNGKAIREENLRRLSSIVKPITERMPVQHEQGHYIGPIAISQAIALLYFKEQKVDVAVIEAGRGGRFDDTNQIPHQMAVITTIMEEHIEQLGPTIKDIVWNKLGIITEEVKQVFIGKQREDVRPFIDEMLENRAHKSECYCYGQHFSAHDPQLSIVGTSAVIDSYGTPLHKVTLPLLGSFQAENYALAYTVANLWSHGVVAQMKQISMDQLRWPGRCEVLEHSPLVLLDGGVHRSSALAVRNLINEIPHERLFVLLSIPKDKDVKGVIQVFSDIADELYTTTTSNPYLNYECDYDSLLHEMGLSGNHIDEVGEAFHHLRAKLRKKDILLCMGTQSFVGDVMRIYGKSIVDL